MVEHYLHAAFAQLERNLLSTLPSLAEPAVADVDRALRMIDPLIETLAGFALGAVIGAVVIASRTCDPCVRVVIDRVVNAARPSPRDGRALAIEAASDSPLRATLGAQLFRRLCLTFAEARRTLQAIETSIANTTPAHLAAWHGVLESVAKDDAAALGFSDQLALGWAHYRSVVCNTPRPEITGEPRWQRTRQLWDAWMRRLRPDPRAVLGEVSHEQVVAAGFVMRIG